jgi:hypothetical protein
MAIGTSCRAADHKVMQTALAVQDTLCAGWPWRCM